MLRHLRILLLVVLPCLFFGSAVDARAQAGRLGGTVVYAIPGGRPVVAKGVRVIAVGYYSQSETRTDGNGNFVLVLGAGAYRVFAQGAEGYVQPPDIVVSGYVNPNSDSYINPNPIYLVPTSRSSDSMISPTPLTLEMAAQQDNTGGLQGAIKIRRVKCKDKPAFQGELVIVYEPAINVRVIVQGAKEQTETRSRADGTFVLTKLPTGSWTIYVEAPAGYHQDTTATGNVIKGQNSSVSPNPIMLIPNNPDPDCAKPTRPGAP